MSETDTAEPITAKPPEDADVVGTPTTDVEDVDEDQDDNAETFPGPTSRSCAARTPATGNVPAAPTPTPSGCTPSWSEPPGSWPTRPTSSSPRNTSTTPPPSPLPSTTCWPASRTSLLVDRSVRSDREPRRRPLLLTSPHCCDNEPDRREHG